MEMVSSALKEYEAYQNEVLAVMLDRLNFFSRKMNCLEKILSECATIIRLSNDNRRSRELSEHILLINLKTLENKYEAEIRDLVKHYEDKISQLNKQYRHKHTHSHK